MIDYIAGKITELYPTYVVIDNNGMGYVMEISLQTYSKLENKSEARVYVQTQANPREGTSVDYGFADKSERDIFRLITSVSGMGASSARMVLSSMTADELTEAILTEDVNRIKAVKGIGLKSAQRMILELKDKVGKTEGSVSETLFTTSDRNAAADEASSALQMLGFSKPNIHKAIQSILKEKPTAKVEEIIKIALKML